MENLMISVIKCERFAKKFGFFIVVMIFAFCSLQSIACARVRVEAPKEPIKVDISMRLDIYQHIEKDIDQIEGIVSGAKENNKSKNNQSLLGYFIPPAFAQEGLGPEVEQAALRRKDRYSELVSWQKNGVIGENKSGLLEVRIAEKADPAVVTLVNSENSDRMIIYNALSKKNNSPVAEIQKLYANRLQKDANPGTPIEIFNQATGGYDWKIK